MSMKIIEGSWVNARGARVGIVVGRFNELITTKLLEGALDGLRRHGVSENNITVAYVPGAVEIPLATKKMALSDRFDVIIAIGCVIQGATTHYDYVCSQVASGVNQVAMSTGIPVIFSVLTTETIEQAIERAGTKCGNKGFEGAMAALEMVSVLKGIEGFGDFENAERTEEPMRV